MGTQSLKDAGDMIARAQSICIASHTRPDGDAVGSVVALASSLRALGKTVYAWNQDPIPLRYQFLEESHLIQAPTELFELDLFVALDTGSKERIGDNVWNNLPGDVPVLVIDHHISNPGYGDLNVIDSTSPATGQLIFELISQMDWPLPAAARDNLWAAIVTDTGSFQYAATSPDTLRVGAALLDAGLDIGEMTRRLFQTHPVRRQQLLGKLLHTMKRVGDGQIAYWTLNHKTKKDLQITSDDTEGLIDHLRAIEGVVVAVSFEEMNSQCIRISARSKDATKIDVSKVCQAFGGGGHQLAAGATLSCSLQSATKQFLAALTEQL